MNNTPDFRSAAYLIIALGAVLALAAAVVPHYTAGYKLMLSVLLIGLLPYFVYGIFTELVRGWPLLVAGVLALGIDILVKIPERFLYYDGYTSAAVYYVSLFLAFVLLPVMLGIATRRQGRRAPPAPGGGKGESLAAPQSE